MNRFKKVAFMILLILSVISVVWGVSRGEVKSVLTKSNNICLECIGIG